ncbi:hypothetical protein PILCRDRAFT_81408 [Piloderma croceum F 1598]|uniref:Uncharacterized protein n=1 Tax=Piloderma croceum (strain F 1598) TaxID=765440 RepID=A0A0C3AGZ9_PILCF|nr:hypothetical protein PILCRDRAFT_81408 [Piloderma croceum F 1598]
MHEPSLDTSFQNEITEHTLVGPSAHIAHSPRSIILQCGILYYSIRDIPDPPGLSFVHDLSKLDRLWDDSSPQWDRLSPVVIRGVPIAIIHWQTIYCYGHNRWWRGISQKWYQWKFLVAEYRSLSPTGFWCKYCHDGVPLKVTCIMRLQCQARRAEDDAMVTRAHLAYNAEEFAHIFAYRTTGRVTRVMTDARTIAQLYRRILARQC